MKKLVPVISNSYYSTRSLKKFAITKTKTKTNKQKKR